MLDGVTGEWGTFRMFKTGLEEASNPKTEGMSKRGGGGGGVGGHYW